MIKSILVVCEGNICRSPMAQGLLASRLPQIQVKSAGCSALAGRCADPMAIDLMAERGIDIGGHIAVDLNIEQVRSAELVLVMTSEQRRRIEEIYPFAKGKVYRIGEYGRFDVTDPYRKGRPAFDLALTQIDNGLEYWLDAIVRLA